MPNSWNYRIVRNLSGDLELCEVYYQDSLIIDIVKNPSFTALIAGGETRDDIVRALRRAWHDARDKTIIDESALTKRDES